MPSWANPPRISRLRVAGTIVVIASVAPILFLAASLVVVLVAISTVRLIPRRKLVAKAVTIPLGRAKPTGAA
jgi:hypothetical protein